MTKISAAAAAAREQARSKATGEFGNQSHTPPEEHDLPGTGESVLVYADDSPEEVARLRRLLSAQTLSGAGLHTLQQRLAYVIHRETSRAARKANLTPDRLENLEQEVLVHLISRLHAKGTVDSPEVVRSLLTSGRLLRQVLPALVQQERFGGEVRAEDVRAVAMLQQREDAFHAREHRGMTRAERDAAAESVRMSWPAGRRPSRGFHTRKLGAVSLELPVGVDGLTPLGELLPAEDVPVVRDEELVGSAQALGAWEDAVSQWQAAPSRERSSSHPPAAGGFGLSRQAVWGLLHDQVGVPRPRPGVVEHAPSLVAAVRAYPGGVSQLAADWVRGEVSEEDARGLFAPFGGDELSLREQELVAGVFIRNRGEVGAALFQLAAREAASAAEFPVTR